MTDVMDGRLHLHPHTLLTPHSANLMASSEVQQTFPINGHVHLAKDADSSHLRDVEHEQSTGSGPVEPTDRPEQDDSLEEAGTAQHEQLRSAQAKESAAPPVLDNPPAGQSAVSSKLKPTSTSPAKRPTPTVQTTTAKSASAPPTPQVKKVFTYSVIVIL